MRLLVCGPREWPGTSDDIAAHLPPAFDPSNVTIIHGGCSRWRKGVQVSVDMLTDGVARAIGYRVEVFPADWSKGNGGGPSRNARMLADGKPDSGLAFGALWKRAVCGSCGGDFEGMVDCRKCIGSGGVWKRTGTGDMVKRMLDARLPVRWIEAPGAPAVDLVEMPEAGR